MSDKTQKSTSDSTSKDIRVRNWSFVIYPGDSCPDNYTEILDDMHLEWVESPLHDKDINADNTPKKVHKHIGVFFDGKKSYNQVLEISQKLNGTIPQIVHNAKSLVRYFAHLDNPEKAQYSPSDILGHGGIDVRSLLAPNSATRYELVREMITWVEENDIREYSDLMRYAVEERYDDWFPVLVDHNSIVMQTHITSRRNKFKEAMYNIQGNASNGEASQEGSEE